MKRILVLGAGGQIGSELVPHLRNVYGSENVLATDLRTSPVLAQSGPFENLDATDANAIAQLAKKFNADAIFNLVALLSALGEQRPEFAWNLNMGALLNTLNVAKELGCAVFTPSSIGAFGDSTPKDKTPQDTIMRPNTMYGVCKVSGELLSDYYHSRFGVDTRSVRFPGIISYVTLAGGGTTDYAVEIYYAAVKNQEFVCPIPQGVYMDMMYMPDALDAIVQLMEADPSKLKHRNSFNVASMSFAPEELYATIRKQVPNFKMRYEIDPIRENIARSWPNSLDDSCARQEWGWLPKWDMESMTRDMLEQLRKKLQ